MAYNGFIYLNRRNSFVKVLADNVFDIGYQRRNGLMVCRCFYKKVSRSRIKKEAADSAKSNQELAAELHKPFVRKFKKDKVYHLLCITYGLLILLVCN